jgi:hypothetical protein
MIVQVLGVSIPIIFILVVGIVLITFFYLRSREKQMLIEKGLSAEEIKLFYEEKRDPYNMLKIGIILISFGLGLGVGLILEDYTFQEYWIPFSIFVITGIGFVVANLVGIKLNKRDKNESI